MFRTRIGLVIRPFSGRATVTPAAGLTLASPLCSVRAVGTTPSASRQAPFSPAAAGSFAQRVKMAAPATGASREGDGGVRTVAPPTSVTAEADGAAPTKRIVKKKVVKRIVKTSGGRTIAAETVSTGEALHRELRDRSGEVEPLTATEGGMATGAGVAASAKPTVTPAAASTAVKASQQKTTLVKGYRIDEVMSLCSTSDAIFARRLPSGGCQFFAWPGTPLETASAAIVSMPDTIRTVHAVFGRWGTPIDLVLDIDCAVPQEHWSMTKIRPFQKKLLDDTLSVISEEIAKMGESIETQVVLQSPNLKKASFHVHTKLKDAAFKDYSSLHGFLARFQERIPHVDLQIYRTNGMLRMFSCMKENHTSAMTVFDDPEWNIGFEGGRVPAEAAALHSVIVRPEGSFTRLLTFDAPRSGFNPSAAAANGQYGGGWAASAGADGDASGAAAARPVIVLLPRTEREAIETAARWLRNATEVEVGEWRPWIGLGLCAFRIAHHFQNATTLERPAMEIMLEAWVEASRHCPQKFRHGDCEQRWATFDIHKLGGNTDWWSAYQRLGRLENATKENMVEQEELRRKNMTSRRPKQQPQPQPLSPARKR